MSLNKRLWTPEEYAAWFASLATKQTPTTRKGRYEIKQTGDLNYLLVGGGREFWADGVREQAVLEVKLVVKPRRSPFIAGSQCPAFVQEEVEGQVRDEFDRIKAILQDESNPLTSLCVITNDERAAPFFMALLRAYNLSGMVVIRPE